MPLSPLVPDTTTTPMYFVPTFGLAMLKHNRKADEASLPIPAPPMLDPPSTNLH